MRRICCACVRVQVPQFAAQRAKTLAAHGIPLVCHSRRANLCGFEGLFKLLEGCKEADGLADVFASRAERRERIEHVDVDLASVCLAGNDVGGGEASLLCDELVELLDLVVVAFEDLEEGRL